MTDCWQAYNINLIGGNIYEHGVVVYELNFVNKMQIFIPKRGKHVDEAEEKTFEVLFVSCMQVFIWRKKFRQPQIFCEFFICVANQYSLYTW